jgi:hypothetical protein
MITAKEMMNQLSKGFSLAPLSFRILETEPREGARDAAFDLFVEASWRERKAEFAVEMKPLWTPKVFRNGINMLKSSSFPEGYRPMLILPFLNEQQLQELEREGISGVDLCGNGVVTVPDLFSVFRTGVDNRFSSSAPIKNIYRKNTSLVARVFLARPGYNSVGEILSEISRRNELLKDWDKSPMSLSTVSKSLKVLGEDLIVRMISGTTQIEGGVLIENSRIIRNLSQPEKLMEKLVENYAPPKITKRVKLKVAAGTETIQELLMKKSKELKLPIMATGLSSVSQYAVMQRGDLLSVYCPSLEKLLERLPGNQSDRFPDLELIETEDKTVYFDARFKNDFWWASPVQTYLELMAGDKRDQETAEQVRDLLLRDIQKGQK